MVRGQPDSSLRAFLQVPRAPEPPNLVYGWPRAEPAFGVVLFADIVGFTALSEKIDPVEVFALLSGFHQEMANLIADHGATIDDYVGDSAVATWIAPEPEASMLQSALSCGFAMREAMEDWNRNRAAALPVARIGIGMHAGPVVVGATGLPRRNKLGAFGDTVNVANRIERMTCTLGTDLIVSDDFFRTLAAEAPTDGRLALFPDMLTARLPGRAGYISIRPVLPIC
jgi:adenylate cyclase